MNAFTGRAPTHARGLEHLLEPVFLPREVASIPPVPYLRAMGASGRSWPPADIPSVTASMKASGIRGIPVSVHHSDLVRRRLPKDVPWKDYPLVGGPFHRPGDFELDGRVHGDSAHAVVLLSRADHWLFDGIPSEEVAGQAGVLAAILSEGRPPPVILALGDTGVVPVSDVAGRGMRGREAAMPLERFLWSYAANFEGPGFKAMEAAGIVRPDERYMPKVHDGAEIPTVERRLGKPMSHPWAVQVLFALDRLSRGGWEGAHPSGWDGRDPLSAFPGGVAGGQGAAGVDWPGTGARPGLSVREPDGPAGETAAFRWACRSLLSSGLASIPSPGGSPVGSPASLTAAGRNLIAILPPDMADPDLLLRWRGGPEGMPMESDIPAMDRWVNDVFRKVKRRLDTRSA